MGDLVNGFQENKMITFVHDDGKKYELTNLALVELETSEREE